MPQNNKPDFWTWIGWNTQPNFEEQPKWLGGLIGFALSLFAVCVVSAAVALVGWFLKTLLAPNAPSQAPEDIRNLALAAAAVIGLPFLVWRSIVAQRQADTAEQGLITDRMNKAVEGLGAVREVKEGDTTSTEPNLEIRLGALYSLKRIAEDSPRDRGQILDMLCAYVRENARAADAEPSPYELYRDSPNDPGKLLGQEQTNAWLKNIKTPRSDITSSLTILRNILALCRRENTQVAFSKDLSRTNFRNALLDGFDLEGWDLSKSNFDGCTIRNCVFTNCNMSDTYWVGAWIKQSHFLSNTFLDAHFFRSIFEQDTQIQFAQSFTLDRTTMTHCIFHAVAVKSDETQFGLIFDGSEFLRVDFEMIEFNLCSFRDVKFTETAKPKGAVFHRCTFDRHTEFPDMDGTGNAFRNCNLTDLHMLFYDAKHWFLAQNCQFPTTLTSEEAAELREQQNQTGDFHHDWRAWQRTIGFQPDENQQ